MKKLLKGGLVVNVFTDELQKADVLMEDGRIIGVDAYDGSAADEVVDVSGKIIAPGFVDGHIHIESTMLTPEQLARVCLLHGTTAIVADPHEIANVCGTDGIEYMLQASEGLPMTVYLMLPSCVPATSFDESGAVLSAAELAPYYAHERVLGLAEMMNYPGVLAGDEAALQKLYDAAYLGKHMDGHAPLLSGKALDAYIAHGISTDHECSNADEAKERIRKGQWVMIREGTAARNLTGLLPLFDEPFSRRCLLVCDDKHPADLIGNGHIDHMVRMAAANGKSAMTAIRMATLQAAECFGLPFTGAVAPGYVADILVLDSLDTLKVIDVYKKGEAVVKDGAVLPFKAPAVEERLSKKVSSSFALKTLTEADFKVKGSTAPCRVIELVKGQLLTNEQQICLDFEKNNGIDLSRDILKLAVIERHRGTGHMGLGFVTGVGLKKGAIAASVSHDSHNLSVIGTNDADMAVAANRVAALGGGSVIVADGRVVCEMPLPVAGLMTTLPAAEAAAQNKALREALATVGVPADVEPFMTMAFISLSVIPSIKMTTLGLVDVNAQRLLPLFVE